MPADVDEEGGSGSEGDELVHFLKHLDIFTYSSLQFQRRPWSY